MQEGWRRELFKFQVANEEVAKTTLNKQQGRLNLIVTKDTCETGTLWSYKSPFKAELCGRSFLNPPSYKNQENSEKH